MARIGRGEFACSLASISSTDVAAIVTATGYDAVTLLARDKGKDRVLTSNISSRDAGH